MSPTHFNPIQTPLLNGINLIEASAGTGKTYAIAMLVLRFVVEQNLALNHLLVVTFTKAATEELKERVRNRLVEAKRAVEGYSVNTDTAVLDWLAGLDIEPDLIRQRLALALLDIDQAAIFTIHGFCQRVLREHALESGQLFDAELTDDLFSIKQACADDFWRKQVYTRSVREVALLTSRYKTPDALLASIDFIAAHLTVYPDCESVDDALSALEAKLALAKNKFESNHDKVLKHLGEGKFKQAFNDSFERVCIELNAWLQGETAIPSPDALSLFTHAGLMDALDGRKLRGDKKLAYLDGLALDTNEFDALAAAAERITLVLRKSLLDNLNAELDRRLQQLNWLSFDNLITRLGEALESDKGPELIAQLQLKYSAALIDEFQDTDDVQWRIFSSIFAAQSHPLYLIGDPKQAIYKFRGADIYSYLAAQKQAEHQFTLGKNWRSNPDLVYAVNRLFQKEQVFLLNDLTFKDVAPAKVMEDGAIHLNGEALAPLMLWQLPESDSKSGYWTSGKAQTEIQFAVVNEIISLLAGGYFLEPQHKKIQPQDIAILVRTNAQARDYQALLRAAGVPSVLNSQESVFATQEAIDLYTLLQAIANPGDMGLLREALALSWFSLHDAEQGAGQALYALFNDESALDAYVYRFESYYQDWQKLGVMSMMQRVLAEEKIRTALSKTPLAERQLTNVQHLIELVQLAAVDAHLGINKTLDWLQTAITKAGSAEEQQLRLESDAEAVKIVTMHRSKGLEYPVVFCPCLWQRSDYLNSESEVIKCHVDGKMIADLGSEDFEKHRKLALHEELAEDLRVFYVAVTRAKFRCYLAWADVRSLENANNSAMAWLMDFKGADFSAQEAILQGLKKEMEQCFDYELLTVPNEITRAYCQVSELSCLSALERTRSLYTHWQMTSYTALSALSLGDAPELPEDKAREQPMTVFDADLSYESLPRGAATGNVVHDLLENCTFADLFVRKDFSSLRDKACQRYGLKLEQPEKLDMLLQAVVATPLSVSDSKFCLKHLDDSQCLKEMPFYLAMQAMDAGQINKILHGSPDYQALTHKQMCGYLTGFIDLICAYPHVAQGRYYVMDYKTNSLENYDQHSLTHAMREHNYGLQYWIYTVVLHRYLQTRLPGYDYERDFGGVRYLFVRGMQPDAAMSGVYEARPDLARVEALAALFGA